MRAAVVAVALLAVSTACSAPGGTTAATASAPAPTSGAPATPSRSASSPAPSPSAAVSASPRPSQRVGLADAPFGETRPALLFRVPGETRLRAVTWDGSRTGTIAATPPAGLSWIQSPDGSRFASAGVVYDRDGRTIGELPWPEKDGGVFTWTPDARAICKARPEAPRTGADLRLEVATIGAAARVVRTVTTFSDNAGYPVLACDPAADRAIVAVLGQGLFAARVFVLRLSDGALVRSADLGAGAVSSWVTATPDGALLAHATAPSASAPQRTTVARADDGTVLATLDDFEAHGFSGDGSLLFGYAARSRAEVREWRSGRVVWSATGFHYAGYLAPPGVARIAVGVSLANDLTDGDVYLVGLDGAALLPRGVRLELRY